MRRIVFIVIVIFCLFIIQNLFRSIYGLWQKQELLVSARNALIQEKKNNIALKEQANKVKQPAFIEEQARDKLLLVKPDEQMVIYPTNLIVDDQQQKKTDSKAKPNWQQWWDLFFK
jgi:cell division protein FtsB